MTPITKKEKGRLPLREMTAQVSDAHTRADVIRDHRGWICLHRKLKEHPRYRDSEFVHVWIHLLLSATHKPCRKIFAGQEITLQPGQLITGRFAIAKATGVLESKVKRILEQLKSDQQIDQQPSNKNSLITILNWHLYQDHDQQHGQPVDSRWTADGQPVDTNNNITIEQCNNISLERARARVNIDAERPSLEEVRAYAEQIGLALWKAEDWFNEMEGGGWLDHAHRPVSSWKAVLRRVRTKWEADGRPMSPPSRQQHASNTNQPRKESDFTNGF